MTSGCCLYCAYAASYWIDGSGNKRVPPVKSFGDMNIYCLHESRAPESAIRLVSHAVHVSNVRKTTKFNADALFIRSLIVGTLTRK